MRGRFRDSKTPTPSNVIVDCLSANPPYGLLHANGTPLILARTIIPAKTIKVAHRNLSHLGTRPLGEVIFSYPKLERLEMDVTLIEPATWSPSSIIEAGIHQPIWGRRTVYAIQQQPLLVSEFFLPDVLDIL